VPLSEIFDVEELSEEDVALANAGQHVRALGMSIEFASESWGAGDTTSSDVTPERWVGFATWLLEAIQDAVTRVTTEPWPEERVDGRRTQADGEACLDGRSLHMWFGPKEGPLIEVARVEVTCAGLRMPPG